MPRNSRAIRDWTPERVDATPVAPHRYLWTGYDIDEPTEYGAFVAAAPYQKGDVVYVADGDSYTRARVLLVYAERDSFHDLRHVYRVQRETEAGHWSRLWVTTWPGLIQRGYQRAGLAPEMPEDA